MIAQLQNEIAQLQQRERENYGITTQLPAKEPELGGPGAGASSTSDSRSTRSSARNGSSSSSSAGAGNESGSNSRSTRSSSGAGKTSGSSSSSSAGAGNESGSSSSSSSGHAAGAHRGRAYRRRKKSEAHQEKVIEREASHEVLVFILPLISVALASLTGLLVWIQFHEPVSLEYFFFFFFYSPTTHVRGALLSLFIIFVLKSEDRHRSSANAI